MTWFQQLMPIYQNCLVIENIPKGLLNNNILQYQPLRKINCLKNCHYLTGNDTYSKKIFFILRKITKFHTHSLSASKDITENVAVGQFAPP